MRALNIFEQAHVVNALPPVNITGGKTSDVISMKNFRGANILVSVGVSAAAFTKIIVEAVSNFNGDNPEAIPYRLYSEETAAGDTFSAVEAVAATGKTPSANDNIMYGINIDASELPDDKPYFQVKLTNGTNSVIASVMVVLTGPGYSGSGTGITAIA